MSWTKDKKSVTTAIYSLGVVVLATAALWFGAQLNTTEASINNSVLASAPAATFNGSGVGPIPDNTGQCQPTAGPPLNVTFNVSGVSGAVSNVGVSITFGSPAHTWAGDVIATLIAPNGASHTIFGRVGATTEAAVGDSSDLNGTYSFSDGASSPPSGGWWQAATAAGMNETIANGEYRTTNSGGAGATNPMPPTDMNPAFAGVTDANGTWTLRLTDGCSGDTGAVSAAVLTVEGGSAPAATIDPNVDFDGDGTSDFSVARAVAPSGAVGNNAIFKAGSVREKMRILSEQPQSLGTSEPGTSIAWFISNSESGSSRVNAFGEADTDFIVPNDYNVDGRVDIAIWRPGPPTVAAFYILDGGNFTVRQEPFGQEGDFPTVTGDYDGDGIADLATFRCPPIGSGDGQCYFFFKGSSNNPNGDITYVPWGFGETFDFFPNPGDFDGDGKFDFCIQRTDPNNPDAGQFVLLRSSDGGVEYINWGRNTDIIVPGDFDGDGKYDFCVSRTETIGNPGISFYILERDGGGTGASPIRWGLPGDIRVPGDYDGDGKTDIAIWRQSSNPALNNFYVRRSSDGAVQTFQWGLENDYPVANWNVH
jgi:hypothetical protein